MRNLLAEPTNYKFAPYAITEHKSKGRIKKEKQAYENEKDEFHHDLYRLIQSKAFQRLGAKTQVIFPQETSPSTNRRTHSLAVAHIAEIIAIPLGLNTFAVKAIAIGHDLGHSPFGHCGERTLNRILEDHNMFGFKHNYQSLLTVNRLEQGYHKSYGLNLMYETRDGILKHTGPANKINIGYYDPEICETPGHPITLEGQVVSIADEIAQRTHDTEDGLRTGRIKIEDLIKERLVKNSLRYDHINSADILQGFQHNREIIIPKTIRALTKYYVYETLESTRRYFSERHIESYDDVVKQDDSIVLWNKDFSEADNEFQKNILLHKFYQHFDVQKMDSKAVHLLKKLFGAFKKYPFQLPEPTFDKFSKAVRDHIRKEKMKATGIYKEDLDRHFNQGTEKCSRTCLFNSKSSKKANGQEICPLNKHYKSACEGLRVIINYIAGMTDLYAEAEYRRIYSP